MGKIFQREFAVKQKALADTKQTLLKQISSPKHSRLRELVIFIFLPKTHYTHKVAISSLYSSFTL